MKRFLLVCLLVSACLSVRAAAAEPPSDEAPVLLQLTQEFDRVLTQSKPKPDPAALARFLHEHYTYTGPEFPKDSSLPPAAQRLSLGGSESTEVAIQIVGPTAIVTGGYSATEDVPSPRFITHGRFTATWVQVGGQWKLLAEHRSLNDVLEWALSAPAKARAAQQAAAKDATPAVTLPPVTPTAAPASLFASTDNTKKTGREENLSRHGHLPKTISQLFRSYEPTSVGYTKDQGDDPFMDFSFSAMFPLHPGAANYPDPVRRQTDEPFFRPNRYTGPNLYFAATIRAGQYIGTRPSSPVVGKRFNPLVAVRFWAAEPTTRRRESEDNFIEFLYGHESNGQFISNPAQFNEQLRVYENQGNATPVVARNTAYLSTRDAISRGWDYLGFQFARDWDVDLFWAPQATIAMRAKFNYYLHTGVLQGDAEQYDRTWEASPTGVTPDPEGRDRKYVDGISFRYTLTVAPPRDERPPVGWRKLLSFERRYALTLTTGYAQPFRYNTLKAEAGVKIYGLPLMLWYRYGYNSDLIDYYRKDHSYGLSLSFWNF